MVKRAPPVNIFVVNCGSLIDIYRILECFTRKLLGGARFTNSVKIVRWDGNLVITVYRYVRSLRSFSLVVDVLFCLLVSSQVGW